MWILFLLAGLLVLFMVPLSSHKMSISAFSFAICRRKITSSSEDLDPKFRMNPNFKPSFLDYPKRSNELKNIYFETSLGILDMMSELQPLGDFQAVSRRGVTVRLYGHDCKVVSLEYGC
jgi:hypothetical protein